MHASEPGHSDAHHGDPAHSDQDVSLVSDALTPLSLRDAVQASLANNPQPRRLRRRVARAALRARLALHLRGIPLSISAAVGFIALSGVAVLNGLGW